MNHFVKRREKAYDMLNQEGKKEVIIGTPETINYLTGIHIIPYERFYGLYLNAEQKYSKMINPTVDTNCMKGRIEEVTYTDEDGPLEAIKSVINGNELFIDKDYFSMKIGDVFSEAASKIEDIGTIFHKMRMFKDDAEIALMQKAADIVDDAIAYVRTKIKPGMTEKELLLMLYSYMAKIPGVITDEFIILALGAENSANPHGVSGDYAFKENDIILMDFCAYYQYYWSDITRCLFLGSDIHPKLEEIYNIVLGANQAAVAKVKPGVKACEIDKAARDYITEKGYGEFFLHRTGHGLGLSVHEEPYITPTNDLVLEEGMTFTIEPGIYLEGIGGVRLEDDILVTKDGCHSFTKTSKKLEDSIISI